MKYFWFSKISKKFTSKRVFFAIRFSRFSKIVMEGHVLDDTFVSRRERESGTVLSLVSGSSETALSNDEKSRIEELFTAVPSSKDEREDVRESKTYQEGIRRLPTTAAYVARLQEEERRREIHRRTLRAPTPLRDLNATELRVRLKEHGFIELAEHLFQDRVNGKMFEFFDTDILENVFDLKHCIKRRDLLGWIRSGSIS